jgi:hypothetical protein
LSAVPNRKKLARQERLDERAAILRSQIDRERRTRNLIIAGFAVLIIGGGLTLYFLTNPPSLFSSNQQTSFHDTSVNVPDEGRQHVAAGTKVNYKHLPPSSGSHYPTPDAPKPANTYTEQIAPEYFVHDLEHGAIVLVYRCDATECPQINTRIFNIFGKLPKEPVTHEVKFMSTPFPNMQPKYALLAWNRELDMTALDENTIIGFYNKYVDKGPEQAPI